MSLKNGAVLFEVTNSCNLNCKHCYKDKLISNDLSLEQIKMILVKIGHYGIKNLVLTGGEPFLREDLFEIIDHAKNQDFESIAIDTNGILLNNSAILNQIKRRLSIISGIIVSLDGASSQTHDFIRGEGQFDKLLLIMEEMKSHILPLGINVTVGKWNLHEFDEFFAIYDKFNALYINFGIFFPLGNGKHIKNQLLSPKDCSKLIQMSNLKRNSGYNVDLCSVPYSRLINEDISGYCCNIFSDFITVTAQGNIIPCIFYDCSCGSLLDSDLDEILTHPTAQLFRNPSKLQDKIRGKCKDCVDFNICKGGCNLLAYALKKDYLESDPLCPVEYLLDF